MNRCEDEDVMSECALVWLLLPVDAEHAITLQTTELSELLFMIG
jgi:hypothetical protein